MSDATTPEAPESMDDLPGSTPSIEHTERQMRFHMQVSRDGLPLVRAHVADTFISRLRGLHALPPLEPSQALIIRPCSAVQTVTMRTSIDVVFLDPDNRVLKLVRLPPRRLSSCRGACAVMELAAGAVARLGLQAGQRLELESGFIPAPTPHDNPHPERSSR